MFWDEVSPVYDLFENMYNRKVYEETGAKVAEMIRSTDEVLECGCGTGAISVPIAKKCRKLIATDCSVGMLRQAAEKCRPYDNVSLYRADVTKIKCRDNRFDKVVAGNVIHLLEEPEKALSEMKRVVKPGGMIILPTYINMAAGTGKAAVKFLEMFGAVFERQFDMKSYREFFENMGYPDVKYHLVEGHMPCAIAVIQKEEEKRKDTGHA